MAAFRRPPTAALLYGLLLVAMAAGQLASLDEFGEALESYDLLGPLVPAAQFGLPVIEVLVGTGLLLSRRLPPLAARAVGLAGVLVAVVWATLAAQAFARGLTVENCGCFGAYLAQPLRWWVLLEDAYLLLLALLAASSLGVGLALRKRPVLTLGVTAALLATPATTSAASERCCFLVDARVSGWIAMTAGGDLEHAGAYAYRARWGWRVRHAARYIEHGRIFNALTPLSSPVHGGVLTAWVFEQRVGLRTPACERRTRLTLSGMSGRAYVSLEDTTEGRIAVVVRAHHPVLESRCLSAPILPSAHVQPAPAGVLLREARALTVRWREPVRAAPSGPVVGSVRVRVRLRVVPEARLGPRPQPASWRSSSRSRSIARLRKSGSAGGSSRPRLRSESSVVSNDR
jgi:Methylamine utilisation protein MauE